MNTADYLLEFAVDAAPAILTRGGQVTYAELKRACARACGALDQMGVQPADRVGILAENSTFWVAAYLAVLKLGAVAVPLPTATTADGLRKKIAFVGCRVLCVDARYSRRFSEVLPPDLPLLSEGSLNDGGPSRWDPPDRGVDARQDAAFMLTSGTTALPRAVRITHRNIQANTDSIIECLDLNAGERMLVILPFYYCFGTSLLHTHLRAGASLALCNSFAYPESALDMLQVHQCTGMAGVPSTFQTLLRNTSFPCRRFPSLRKVQQAGGKLPSVFLRKLSAALPEARIFVMYGQTEATARLSCLSPELVNKKTGSVGCGIPGVTLRVVDDLGRPVQPGQTGEIVAQGDNISPGYYMAPEASAQKFVAGALRTGDLATVDEDGFIYIVDRKSDFIKSSGHRVSSQEVEEKILELNDVVAAAAVGQPDPVAGEAIKVFVTLRKGASISPEAILNHCRTAMVRHMVPKQVLVVDHLPTNAHGKVVKAQLREQMHAG